MNKFFILINIIIHFVVNPLFVSYSYSNNEIKYLKVKTFSSGKKPFDYNSLKKIIVPNRQSSSAQDHHTILCRQQMNELCDPNTN